jgi:O-antigen/teichoic acid export membrane protein
MSTDKMQNLKSGLLYIVPFLVGSVLPIITLPIFTRILTVEDYGIYALTIVYGVFVSGIANFGLTVGYERNFFNFSGDKQKTAALLFSTLSFVICSIIILGFLTFLFKEALAKLIIGSSEYGNLLVWAFFATAITSLKVYFLTYFKNSENAKSFVWYSIDENLLNVVFSLFFVVYMKLGVLGLILGQLIAGSIVFILLIIKFVKMLPFVFSLTLLKDSLKLSLPLTSRIFFGIIGTQFDKYMIGLLNTVGGVGIYNLGQKIANIVFVFMTAIQNVYSPQVYKRMFEMDEKEGGKSIGQYLTPFIYISIIGGIFVALFSEEIIFMLTPFSYHSATNVVSILALLFGTYFFGKQPQLIYAKKTGVTSILTINGILLNVVINIPFIKYWGFIGAAYGTLLAGIISGSIFFWISQKYYLIQWEANKLIVIYASFFVFTFVTIFLRDFGVQYELRLLIKISFMILYGGIGVWLGYINKQSYTELKGLLKSSSKPV